MTKEELARKMANAAGVVKLVCGLGNNAAWLACMDAHDVIRKHPRYEQRVRGGHEVGYFYRKAMKMYTEYEKRLIYTNVNRFFHVADMPESTRKKYGNITDREYYEFWTGIGGAAYARSRPFITSLQNKYRLSLSHHGIPSAEMVAWAMTAQACLNLAVQMYNGAIKSIENDAKLPHILLERTFGIFSLKDVAKVWSTALDATEPSADYELEDLEERNISQGIIQLQEAWTKPDEMYGATMASVQDFDEVFRTKGEMKKALREIAEYKAETKKEL